MSCFLWVIQRCVLECLSLSMAITNQKWTWVWYVSKLSEQKCEQGGSESFYTHTECQLTDIRSSCHVREALPASPPTTGSALQGLMTNVSQKQPGLWRQGSANVRLSGIEKEGNEDGVLHLGFWSEDMGWEKRMEPHSQVFKRRVMWEALLGGCGTAGMDLLVFKAKSFFS